MDANNKQQSPKGGEVSMAEKKREVVVAIPNEGGDESLMSKQQSRVNSPHRICNDNEVAPKSPPLNCASPEIRFMPSPNKPPKVPTSNANLTRRKSLTRSVYSKPKSRFGEQPYPIDGTLMEENGTSTLQEQLTVSSSCKASPNKPGTVNRTVSIHSVITPRTPLMASPGQPGRILMKSFTRKLN
ncbi:Mechanosensitive ion channel protein 9 [Spatholobus suberectus]|nr:Mechanosensitive ion channel protein 9 [Spatholobus suberectus]